MILIATISVNIILTLYLQILTLRICVVFNCFLSYALKIIKLLFLFEDQKVM